ncbi:unnamed protein product [Ranitomeya imitator]|uniref:Uncharacterized protein n=1 Tax=Ranitomeya imitator TaxID=111125 RepID=A0ABN9KXT7_9NEOB|nr:unnamed protein product [Ranitomeya imitator]
MLLFQGHVDNTELTKMLRYLSAVFFLLLALSYMSSAAPYEPQHPGDQASPEQLAQYYADLYEYITFVTRPSLAENAFCTFIMFFIQCIDTLNHRQIQNISMIDIQEQ